MTGGCASCRPVGCRHHRRGSDWRHHRATLMQILSCQELMYISIDYWQAEQPSADKTDHADRHDHAASIGRQVMAYAANGIEVVVLVLIKVAASTAIIVVVGILVSPAPFF